MEISRSVLLKKQRTESTFCCVTNHTKDSKITNVIPLIDCCLLLSKTQYFLAHSKTKISKILLLLKSLLTIQTDHLLNLVDFKTD